MSQPSHPESDNARILRQAMVAMGGIGLAVLLWQLHQLLLVLFASMLVAMMLHDFGHLLQRRLRLPFALALPLAVILPLLFLAVVFGLFGTLMFQQFVALSEQLPEAAARLEGWLRSTAPGREAIAEIEKFAPSMSQILGIAQSALGSLGTAVTDLAVVLVAAVFIAAQPRLYVDGVIGLLDAARAARARETFGTVRTALTAWLKAQAIGMAFVAVGTTAGLSLIGLPSALAIGLVAGLCEFVPYLGVVVVTVPTVVLAFGQDVQTGWLTILVLVVVQQLQGNVVMPIAQRSFGDLPPVLTIFSLIAAGTLMGPLGVILAVPLTVVGMALLRVRLHRLGRTSALTGDVP